MAGLTKFERSALALVSALTALAGIGNYAVWPAIPRFFLATAALAGLAWMVSFGTQQVGERFGPGVTGLMQSTMGNLPELFVVVFALKDAQLVVAQTAIVGSLLANALLVLGMVIVVGARRAPDGVMRFSRGLPKDTSTLLLVTVFIIVLLGLLLSSRAPAAQHVEVISAVGAVCLLVVYLTWLVPYLRSDQRPSEQEQPRVPLVLALAVLVLSGLGAAFVSDWFIDAVHPAIGALGFSKPFVGLVVVAIAGNAVENAVGVVLAYRGKSDLAISVVKNSVAQIAAFLFPALVLISLLLHTHLTFSLQPVYIGALALMAVIVRQVTDDGEAEAFEGVALAALYLLVAVVAAYQ